MPYIVWKIMRKFLKCYSFGLKNGISSDVPIPLEADAYQRCNTLWRMKLNFMSMLQFNNENCHIWETENFHAITNITLHSPKVRVWSEFIPSFIVGSYFLEKNTRGVPTTWINSERYRKMLLKCLIPVLEQRECSQSIHLYASIYCITRAGRFTTAFYQRPYNQSCIANEMASSFAWSYSLWFLVMM